MSNPTRKLQLGGGTLTGQLNFSGTNHAGLKLLSLTTVQRDALTPANGMVIYNTTNARVEKYSGGSWVGDVAAQELYEENPSSPATPVASGTNSVAIGDGASATRDGEIAFGSGISSKTVSKLILRASTTDATQTEMVCGSGSSYLTLANPSSIVSVTGTIIALRHDNTGELVTTTSCYDWRFSLLASAKSASGIDAQIVGDVEISPRTGVSTSYSVDIDVVTGLSARVRFRVTGAASENVEWVCNAEITSAIV
jgi:hypothetical protein